MEQSFSQSLADITLPNTGGSEVRLGSLWEQKPCVLVFLRHYGCIFCRENIAQLCGHEAAIREKGANLAAIGLGDLNYARMFREETGMGFPLLVDEQRLAFRTADLHNGNLLHLLGSDNAVARKRAQAAGFRQHKMGANPFQLGATFIFGPGNVDLYTYRSKSFGDNASPEEILRAIP